VPATLPGRFIYTLIISSRIRREKQDKFWQLSAAVWNKGRNGPLAVLRRAFRPLGAGERSLSLPGTIFRHRFLAGKRRHPRAVCLSNPYRRPDLFLVAVTAALLFFNCCVILGAERSWGIYCLLLCCPSGSSPRLLGVNPILGGGGMVLT